MRPVDFGLSIGRVVPPFPENGQGTLMPNSPLMPKTFSNHATRTVRLTMILQKSMENIDLILKILIGLALIRLVISGFK